MNKDTPIEFNTEKLEMTGSDDNHDVLDPKDDIGKLWRVNDPESIWINNRCFLYGRLKTGDLLICTGYGDATYRTYAFVTEYIDCMTIEHQHNFSALRIGDSTPIVCDKRIFENKFHVEHSTPYSPKG